MERGNTSFAMLTRGEFAFQVLDCFVYADQHLLACHNLMANARVMVHLESSVEVSISHQTRMPSQTEK